MNVHFYNINKLLLFEMFEEIDECSVKELRRRADYEIERFMPREVVFDFDNVSFMDSAGIGMVIGRYKRANMIGAKTGVANLNENIRKIFEMSGVLKIISEVDLVEKMKMDKNELEVAGCE